jgi:hypothetical protein
MISVFKLGATLSFLASSSLAAPAPVAQIGGASAWEEQLLGLTPGPKPTSVQGKKSVYTSIEF